MARRRAIRVEMSSEHSDFFRKNLKGIVVEERLALGVPRPSAIVSVTGLN